ncbi:hypothetical protein ACJX0J_038831 [Zea mays]
MYLDLALMTFCYILWSLYLVDIFKLLVPQESLRSWWEDIICGLLSSIHLHRVSIYADDISYFLHIFGESNVYPIQCGHEELEVIPETLQPIVDRIVDRLLGWKADLMTRAGRKLGPAHASFRKESLTEERDKEIADGYCAVALSDGGSRIVYCAP